LVAIGDKMQFAKEILILKRFERTKKLLF